MAAFGSKGSSRPRSAAVPGMNCAMPCAPLGLTAPGLKRLSFQMSRTKNIAGNPLASACCCISGQTVSTKGLGWFAAISAAAAMPSSTSSLCAGSGHSSSAKASPSEAIFAAGRRRKNAPAVMGNSWGYPVEECAAPRARPSPGRALPWPAAGQVSPGIRFFSSTYPRASRTFESIAKSPIRRHLPAVAAGGECPREDASPASRPRVS